MKKFFTIFAVILVVSGCFPSAQQKNICEYLVLADKTTGELVDEYSSFIVDVHSKTADIPENIEKYCALLDQEAEKIRERKRVFIGQSEKLVTSDLVVLNDVVLEFFDYFIDYLVAFKYGLMQMGMARGNNEKVDALILQFKEAEGERQNKAKALWAKIQGEMVPIYKKLPPGCCEK